MRLFTIVWNVHLLEMSLTNQIIHDLFDLKRHSVPLLEHALCISEKHLKLIVKLWRQLLRNRLVPNPIYPLSDNMLLRDGTQRVSDTCALPKMWSRALKPCKKGIEKTLARAQCYQCLSGPDCPITRHGSYDWGVCEQLDFNRNTIPPYWKLQTWR